MIREAIFCSTHQNIKALLARIVGFHSHDHFHRWSQWGWNFFFFLPILEFVLICDEALKACQKEIKQTCFSEGRGKQDLLFYICMAQTEPQSTEIREVMKGWGWHWFLECWKAADDVWMCLLYCFFCSTEQWYVWGKMPVVIRFVFKFNVAVCLTVNKRQVNTQPSSLIKVPDNDLLKFSGGKLTIWLNQVNEGADCCVSSHFYLPFTSEGILSKPISNDCSFHLSILIFTERHLECTVIPLGAENWAIMYF